LKDKTMNIIIRQGTRKVASATKVASIRNLSLEFQPHVDKGSSNSNLSSMSSTHDHSSSSLIIITHHHYHHSSSSSSLIIIIIPLEDPLSETAKSALDKSCYKTINWKISG